MPSTISAFVRTIFKIKKSRICIKFWPKINCFALPGKRFPLDLGRYPVAREKGVGVVGRRGTTLGK